MIHLDDKPGSSPEGRARGRDDLVDALRAATREDHARLERRLDLLGPRLCLERYRRLLEAMLGFYAPLEQRLFFLPRWSEIAFDPAPRRKRHLLEKDLLVLGLDEAALRGLPRCSSLPSPGDAREAMGCLYVLEGSTLGGRIIARHVEAALGVARASGGAFFAGYGEQTGVQWRTFLSRLVEVDDRGPARERIVELGRETFLSLEEWLQDRGLLD